MRRRLGNYESVRRNSSVVGVLLEEERDDMAAEQKELLAARDKKAMELDTVNQQLRNNAAEYLILARTSALDYDNPRRFENVCEAYENSIRSWVFKENLHGYALFLHKHNQYTRTAAGFS